MRHRLGRNVWRAVGTLAIVGCTAIVAPAAEPELDVQAELRALRAEVSQLRAKSEDSWLTERRAEEVKSLVREVLADADTRASLAEGGMLAGHNGKHFFLASEDGNFLMEIAGRVQFRYIANFADDRSTFDSNGDGVVDSLDADPADDTESGFQMRRAKLEFYGHVFDPKLQYKIVGGFDRSGGEFILEEAFIKYAFADQHYVQAGQFKGRFNREELVSSKRQLAVDRSNVNEFFTLDYSQGVQVGGNYDMWNWSVVLHDGRESENVDFASDFTDFAVAGRAELLLAGKWKQFQDFATWDSDEFGLMVGGGIDYENGEGGGGASGVNWEHMIQWTADVSVEMMPFTFFAAVTGRYVDMDAGITGFSDDSIHQVGFLVQGSVFIVPNKWDVFARYEWLDFDGDNEVLGSVTAFNVDTGPPVSVGLPAGVDDEQHAITFGTNYYFKKHDVKMTFDVVWAPDGLRRGESGAGLIGNTLNEEDEIAIRGQLQLLF